jgi:hypothetical protein
MSSWTQLLFFKLRSRIVFAMAPEEPVAAKLVVGAVVLDAALSRRKPNRGAEGVEGADGGCCFGENCGEGLFFGTVAVQPIEALSLPQSILGKEEKKRIRQKYLL